MSSYNSLFRVLSPSRVQTKFEENSLPASSNRYMAEFTLFCYVLGTPVNSAIPIDIGSITKVDGVDVKLEKLNFGHIKKLIWPSNNNANELKLRTLETPLKEDNEALKELNKNFSENIELSDVLSPGIKFLTEFPVGHEFPDNYIHIIAQPPLPATTERRPTKRLKLETEVGDPSFNDLLDVVAHLKRESTRWKEDFIEHPTGKDLPIVQQPKLYIREDYKALYQIINNKELDPNFLINGTSGIGKSCFLLYLLVRLLCSSDNITIVFQAIQSKLFYCFKDSKLDVRGTFEEASYYLYDPNTWYLADSIPPRPRLKARTVLAVSPIGYNENKKFDEFSKVVVNKYCMAPWIINELKVCRDHIFPDVAEDLMLRLYDKAGGVPRYVLEMPAKLIKQNEGEDVIVQKSISRIENSILKIADFNEFLLCFTNKADYVKISNCLIHRWPDSSYNYDDHTFQWASSYVYEKIMDKLVQYRWDLLLRKIRDPFDPSNARGILFETYVLNIFKNGNNFEIKCLQETENEEQHLQVLGFEKYTYIRTAEDLLQYNDDNIAIRPTVRNFGAVDLILTQDKIFQITVSNKHPIKQNEIVKVIQNMPAFQREDKIRLFFVVPDDVYDGFTYQNYVTERKDKDKDKDIDDKDPDDLMFRKVKRESSVLRFVEQWVLKVDLSVK